MGLPAGSFNVTSRMLAHFVGDVPPVMRMRTKRAVAGLRLARAQPLFARAVQSRPGSRDSEELAARGPARSICAQLVQVLLSGG